MPLYKSIALNEHTFIKIWKIEESYTDLFKSIYLKPECLERVSGMKSEWHQRGFLSVRKLLAEFGYTDEDLIYDENGKPHLKDGKHISITHSFNFSAIIVSENNTVGIDIEKQREKISVIADKFVDYEFDYLKSYDEHYVNKLTVIWCAKESLYKLYATPGLSFKQHCLVIPFLLADNQTVAWIDYQDKKVRYHIHFLEFEGFTCAYAIS